MALVLTRRVDESILIKNHATGQTIRVAVARIQTGSVRLAIDADREWNIVRSELLEGDAK